MHALPWSIQNRRVSAFGLESVSGSHFGCEKKVGLKSQPRPRALQKSTHFLKCFGSSLSRSTQPPFLLVENRVARVQVDLLRAGAELQRDVQVRHQLLRRAGAAGVIAGRLDAAGQRRRRVAVKAAHVVALPAVQRDRNACKPADRLVRIDASAA